MFRTLSLLLCLFARADDVRPPPDPARVKTAVAELEKAAKSDSAPERARVLLAQGNVPDPAVVKLVARALRDKEPDVQRAAIEALRFVAHPDALKELQSAAREEKPLRKLPELHAALLRAIGQYGDPSSVRILGEDAWSDDEAPVIQARILGLGRIRTREAVDKLIDLMKSASAARLAASMPDFRLALVSESGVDRGNSPEGWQSWWNEHRSELKFDARPTELPTDLARKWKTYWGDMEYDARPTKRADRGRGDRPGS
ncbi:MAG: HEAT repeat domain-containing protein [Planctomycetes bacterium]|nr:HEAT repeat domain-containing protein [Planctomycetota bacterium]